MSLALRALSSPLAVQAVARFPASSIRSTFSLSMPKVPSMPSSSQAIPLSQRTFSFCSKSISIAQDCLEGCLTRFVTHPDFVLSKLMRAVRENLQKGKRATPTICLNPSERPEVGQLTERLKKVINAIERLGTISEISIDMHHFRLQIEAYGVPKLSEQQIDETIKTIVMFSETHNLTARFHLLPKY